MTPREAPPIEHLPAAHARKQLTIAMIGTRGVPAAYGGFETAVEEIGRRLVERGHDVTVYSRAGPRAGATSTSACGSSTCRRCRRSSSRRSATRALGRCTLSCAAGPTPRSSSTPRTRPSSRCSGAPGIPIALHMDGLEWQRGEVGRRAARRYYRWAEQFGVREADALIADAPGIADYYDDQFGVPTELIRYGAPILETRRSTGSRELGLDPGGYHLVVARFEPENHVDEIVEGYRASSARAAARRRRIGAVRRRVHAGDPARPRTTRASASLGGVYDQELLDQLYLHAHSYVHGHSVGGTNPSLLRAMGAGTASIAYDVVVQPRGAGRRGVVLLTPRDLGAHFAAVEADGDLAAELGRRAQDRARVAFRWDDVADAYERLAVRLAQGESMHAIGRSARRAGAAWDFNTTEHLQDEVG